MFPGNILTLLLSAILFWLIVGIFLKDNKLSLTKAALWWIISHIPHYMAVNFLYIHSRLIGILTEGIGLLLIVPFMLREYSADSVWKAVGVLFLIRAIQVLLLGY